jgi:hypothetical protein
MPERANHCPFLNRSEPRCSSHFSLNGLVDALEQCFDQYPSCSVYRELLRERRARRGELPGQDAWATGYASDDGSVHGSASGSYGSQVVQLSCSASSSPH